MLLTALPVENSNVKTEGGPTQFNQNPDKKVKYEKLNLPSEINLQKMNLFNTVSLWINNNTKIDWSY